MSEVKRDGNRVPGLLAETNDSNRTATPLIVDPSTDRLMVTSTISNFSSMGGLLSGVIYDAASLSQATLTDTWTFYSGGVGGTLVATITITYTNSSKTTISTVVKT
jgi:hypothetical protein